MSCKTYAFTCSIALITLLAIRTVAADIDDNEVNDAQDHYMIQGVKVYQGDRQCVLVGGLCVHSSDCLQPTTNKGLCPSNAHRGVECCYELPVRPAPCVQHMGACMGSCPKPLTRPGIDCESGKICCVLI